LSDRKSRNSVNADLGIYAQDSWTLGRLTVNAGVRFEHFNASIEATSSPAGRFLPARSFPEVKNLPNFNGIVPRFGVAYDVFGDGRTAIKASVGKYVAGMGLGNPEGTRNYDPTAPS
jgi:outer membrane receptor for Fe3+-dicitrate